MRICTFFGHRECYPLEAGQLENAIEEWIGQGVDTFYVGNQGGFDAMVHSCLKRLSKRYPHIRYAVVLAYLPERKRQSDDFSDTMYPEGLEQGPPRFAIERRNRWMLAQADCCICYVNSTWGGAYKFVRQACRRGLTVRNLGRVCVSDP